MEIITLKLKDVLALKSEIYGISNRSLGLLKQNLPYFVKYWLHDLGNKVLVDEAIINKMKDELILKYGVPNSEGNMEVSPSIEDGVEVDSEGNEKKKFKINPNFVEFHKEYTNILNEDKEIEYKPFKLDDLKTMVTNEDYPTFRKLVIE